MRLPLTRSKDSKTAERSAPPRDEPGSVEAARTKARRRLVGALVLLVAGVIAFPLLFETQPRPIAVNTPIEIAQSASLGTAGVVASMPAAVPERVTGGTGAQSAAPSVGRAESVPAADVGAAATPATPATPVPPADTRSDDAAAARAALEPAAAAQPAKAEAAAAPPEEEKNTARFIVQAGAYGEAAGLRDARARLEKMGLKTYTQVIENDAGKRTRLRVGPFATRQEAEAVAGKVKGAGLPANVLVL